ncbi:MAG: GNAT family N-acetyltransferase [Candidatus Iainarchaeum sp.]|nr:MAG: TDP-fucosamine acetyltransferase [archaeon ADurb.Bin336]
MNITLVNEKDVEWLNKVIKTEFPYTKFDTKKISEKINSLDFCILVARQENIQIGFCETELFPQNQEARLNAIFVEDAWRGRGIGKTLIERAINKCKHKRIQKIFLLVKEENIAARNLYKKTKFVFKKIHHKKIDSSTIEEWEQKI